MSKALVIVDMQRAYFEDELLASRRAELVEACNRLITNATQHGCPVYCARTQHTRDRSTWTLNMIDDGQGFAFAGQDDAQFVEGLKVASATEIIKTRDSAFWATPLLDQLRSQGINTLVLAGVSTHLCIANTAIDAYSANIRVELAVDAIASHKPDLHDQFLSFLHDEYRMPRVACTQNSWS